MEGRCKMMDSWEKQLKEILQDEPMTKRERALLHAAGIAYMKLKVSTCASTMAWMRDIRDTLEHLRADNKRLREKLNERGGADEARET